MGVGLMPDEDFFCGMTSVFRDNNTRFFIFGETHLRGATYNKCFTKGGYSFRLFNNS